MSADAAANAYSRFVSNVADYAVSIMRTTNNLMFSNLDSMKSVMQQVKDNSKQIFSLNANAAKTFEQNSKQVTRVAQDSSSKFNTSISNSGSGSGSGSSTYTTSDEGNTTAETSSSSR
jgi:hypothetical protein